MAEGNPTGTGNLPAVAPNPVPNQVIHIRSDSDSELQALFDSVLQPNSTRPKTVPLRLRKLPDSFFNPPNQQTTSTQPQSTLASRLSHSRDSSVDSGANLRRGTSPLPGPQSVHFRAHSSPATLEQTLSLTPNQNANGNTPSGSTGNLSQEPLPPGWEQAATPEGQIYFINHVTRSTTWEDPRKTQQQQQQAQGQQLSAPLSAPPAPAPTQIATTLQQVVAMSGPMPEGWEQAMTPEGQVYFINHVARTTTWFDPRLPPHLQRPAILAQQNGNPTAPAPQPQAAAGTTANPRQQEVRLQQLQLERERLKMRQQEIMRQMEAEQQRLQKRKPEEDPFLGDHTRQESADSGLGIAYSLPHTPEDFLQEPFQTSTDENMELSTGLPAEEELVPSIEEISNELLEEIQHIVAKDTMTWL